ncbi:MAG: alpha-hydroxy acid oxidase [Candidatus Dormibacteria bacterium]
MSGHQAGLPVTLAEFEPAAREALPAEVYDYIAGGAGEERTLAANVDAWRRIPIVPHVLSGRQGPDLSVTVVGRSAPHPLIVAPMAYQRIASEYGEIDMAQAAAATESILCLSTLATVAAPAVAGAVSGGRRWFQVYVFSDRGLTHELIAQALACGYDALVVTVDLPTYGMRDRDTRSGFAVDAVVPSLVAAGRSGELEPEAAARVVDAQLSWADIAGLASRYDVPVLVKGVLSAGDATRALAEGAAGVVVSNHGGRQLDGTPATARVLAGIADAVAGEGDVLVDGGIRRGTDVLRALALGANAVMVGRPLFWGLAVGGAAGAQRVLELLLEEFANALCLSGAMAARSLDRGFLGPPE